MAPKNAKPGRYLVDIRGTADPDDSEYYVINVVHDAVARTALRYMVRSFEMQNVGPGSVKAGELSELLERAEGGGWGTGNPKAAKPERYIVEIKGDLDSPDGQYFVVNLVYDWVARPGLWFLARRYREAGMDARAAELVSYLKETDEACSQIIQGRNQTKKNKVGRPKSARASR